MGDDKSQFISIMSGKGGTGKTLFTAVLGRALAREGHSVLLVDLDIFVRGLSILLADYTKRRPESKEATISDLLLMGKSSVSGDWLNIDSSGFPGLAISRFFECDVLPASRDIGDPLDYDEMVFTSPKYSHGFIKNLIHMVKGKYDFVLFDCRAGIDSFVVTIASESDFVISVAEDDDVCLKTNNNLINHFRYKKNIKRVFTLINKGRRITSYQDLKDKARHPADFNFIGVIPFDMEVMEDFGKERFWNTVYETLYFRAIIDSWNYFAERNSLSEISERKYRFPPSIFMSKKAGRLSLLQRMFRLYGSLFTLMGLSLFLYRYFVRYETFSTIELMIFFTLIAGILFLLLSSFDFRKWILGDSDSPKQK